MGVLYHIQTTCETLKKCHNDRIGVITLNERIHSPHQPRSAISFIGSNINGAKHGL